jgi:hypothetical protein
MNEFNEAAGAEYDPDDFAMLGRTWGNVRCDDTIALE